MGLPSPFLYNGPRVGPLTTKTPDGFGYPDIGGPVNARSAAITYQLPANTAVIFLPQNAEIQSIDVYVNTVFNDSGTNLLTLGIAGTPAYFMGSTTVAALGQLARTNMVFANWFTKLAQDTFLTATFTGQNSNASTGAAVIAVNFILR